MINNEIVIKVIIVSCDLQLTVYGLWRIDIHISIWYSLQFPGEEEAYRWAFDGHFAGCAHLHILIFVYFGGSVRYRGGGGR